MAVLEMICSPPRIPVGHEEDVGPCDGSWPVSAPSRKRATWIPFSQHRRFDLRVIASSISPTPLLFVAPIDDILAAAPNMGSNLTDRGDVPYLNRTVQDLFSLKGRVTVITGGARGIGLAWAFACAEAGSHIAILDRLDQPHEHFSKLLTDFDVKVKLYS